MVVLVMSLPERIEYFRNHRLVICLIKKLFRNSDGVLTLSEYVQHSLGIDFDIPTKAMKVLYFGIDNDFWYPEYSLLNKDDFILSIGNDMNRDYRTLVEALPKNIKLKLVTKKNINTLGKEIEVLSGISDKELRDLYNQALFVIVPSIKLKNESSGLSCTLQAMACRKAVIVSDAPPLRELFMNNEDCLFYDPENVGDLKNKIDSLVDNDILKNNIAQNGYLKVTQKFTCKIMGKRLESILNGQDYI
ncbi:MAG: glycosyltransferase family 4 protein [Planctomycetes bacterium]|nr:glycosyltransferase family 4 protein [Planctomycetota bacterium]